MDYNCNNNDGNNKCDLGDDDLIYIDISISAITKMATLTVRLFY